MEGFNMFSETVDPGELLQESKIAYQTLLDNSFDAIIAIDAEGMITIWNHRAESMFGWQAEEVIGKPLTQTIIPPAYREAHINGLKRFIATKEIRVLNQRLELTAVHRKGFEIPIEISISASSSSFRGKSTFTAIIKDITENKNTLKEIRVKELE
jgi:PAS domain S-box-containing protein